jgi:adenine-specific DNA methylase
MIMSESMTSFIERQFPVSKLSKESYKERKANNGQTLTGLGKWWGRKPLVLVRAAILGCLMPASENPRRDMEIFLKIMSMDEHGLWLRHMAWEDKSDNYWHEREKELYRDFESLGYDEKIKACVRPEQFERPADDFVWNEINHHLKTNAHSLQELMRQLAEKRFGKNAVIGDCFCGGGSIPFEAARMGLEVYASDLNPIAGLLTWAAINICGASDTEIQEIRRFQQEVYDAVDKEITELGIEHNEKGDRAVSYLYCVEAVCPECGAHVPMAPSWVIGKGTKTVAILNKKGDYYDISVKTGANADEIKSAGQGTATSKGLLCPHCGKATPISVLRRDRKDDNGNTVYGLRRWEKSEFEPRTDDVFQERLYAVRYEHEYIKNGKKKTKRYYRAPNERDLQNEERVRRIVAENIVQWQEQGLVPSMEIESGYNTDQLIRERGWSHWNHLFNARQLLVLSYLASVIGKSNDATIKVSGILGFHKCIDWNSRLCRWNPGIGNEKSEQTYYNQALNTMLNWGTRSLYGASTSWFYDINSYTTSKKSVCLPNDARSIDDSADFWITDPPYADAVNYHELTEFFLAWDKRLLKEAFPDWYSDNKRVLAVRGGESFAQSMIEIYTNLTNHMPDNGMQVVMFTHSDPAVWAQLALIMWKSGLKVTAAWNIATETDASGLKDGNYVKGTVLLVLRKRAGASEAFLDEINADIKNEVYSQIESMQKLDDKDDPNFSDPDYVLAAYAASLKALTSYSSIGEIDLDYELDKAINDPKNSKVVALIERAKKQAYDCIIPAGFDGFLWKELSPAERFYIKGLESEKNGNYQISTYQEYARGFAITSYSQLMANERANTCRLKTPQEFAMRTVSDVPGFEASVLRLILAAIHIALKEDEKPDKGLWHLKNNLPDYWGSRDTLKQLLSFLKDAKDIANMPHWKEAAQMAEHIYVLVDNDHV